MPHLPKKLAPVGAAVASILLPQDHVSRLYSATDIASALNVIADVDSNDAIRNAPPSRIRMRGETTR